MISNPLQKIGHQEAIRYLITYHCNLTFIDRRRSWQRSTRTTSSSGVLAFYFSATETLLASLALTHHLLTMQFSFHLQQKIRKTLSRAENPPI